jgi:hypothetical protein
MGAWDLGPFDNDTAADFSGQLDDAAESERENLVRGALTEVLDEDGYLDQDLASEAVAAAALIAAQCPGGTPVDTAYGPNEPLPRFSAELRALAVRALDRVVTEPSELMELWEEVTEDGTPNPWHTTITDLRNVLAPVTPVPNSPEVAAL